MCHGLFFTPPTDAAEYTVRPDTVGTSLDLAGSGEQTGGSAGVVDRFDDGLRNADFGNTAPGSAVAAVELSPGGSRGVTLAAPPEPGPLVALALGSWHLLAAYRKWPGRAAVVQLRGSRKKISRPRCVATWLTTSGPCTC